MFPVVFLFGFLSFLENILINHSSVIWNFIFDVSLLYCLYNVKKKGFEC